MASPLSMQPHIPQSIPSLAPQNGASSQHNYGTRIRKNSVLKPSARLRQSPSPSHPAPRRIKPVPIPGVQRQQPLEDPALPVFPLPNVMLHAEDASSKVFQAIGRSFLSVDNRAMTIKDLAEMTLKYGLMCQKCVCTLFVSSPTHSIHPEPLTCTLPNLPCLDALGSTVTFMIASVSAASQAITTYIRNHLSRCEAQQDHPLLLRHILSGTAADDDLVPALHSRMGGAIHPSKSTPKETGTNDRKVAQPLPGSREGERPTNFRRGTMVWYLSKAAGVSCPFARAGIRLCEYGKEGKVAPGDPRPVSRRKARRDQAQCGEKRKRLRRGCRQNSEGSDGRQSDRVSPSPAVDSGYGEVNADSCDSSDSDGEPPPKVKLTLRLRPSAPREVIDLSNGATSSSEDDADDDDVEMRMASPDVPWRLPPYPRRSIVVPCYTPACDDRLHPFAALPRSHVPNDERRRSPSVPCSASPPPDSDRDGLDVDADSDLGWDPSILVSPAVAPNVECSDDQHAVKQEPLDVRDMLDAWENLDCAPTNPSTVSSATVKLPSTDDIKLEELELWEWEFESGWAGASRLHEDVNTDVKIEFGESVDLGPLSLVARVPPEHAFSVSPCSPFTSSTSSILSRSSPTSDSGVGSFTFACPCPSPLSPSAPSTCMYPSSVRLPVSPVQAARKDSALTWKDVELLGPDTVHPQEFEDGWIDEALSRLEPRMQLPRISEESVTTTRPHESPDERRRTSLAEAQDVSSLTGAPGARPVVPNDTAASDVVVVHTCQPCIPAISATQVEGISVYQTTLGSTTLLRRIDTDFVNLTTILSHLSLPVPVPLPQACIVIAHPSPSITGIWAPLTVARVYINELPEGTRDIFLSDELVMRFPTALQDFHKKSTPGRMLNQFGPYFGSSIPSHSSPQHSTTKTDSAAIEKETAWEPSVDAVSVEEPILPIPPSYDLAFAALRPFESTEHSLAETPLSATEQEMFRALCVHPDWEAEKESDIVDIEGEVGTEVSGRNKDEMPLRRSKRVADAAAARSRAVPPRTRGPRHS
ncbi:hypothetical protein F5I97DRAFT_1924265 [Phlebopus sp. FC_14]|nr:hypothetical protein F5I97DRAFT_1924265 [Phlebopus sp. FC_14]